MPSNLIGFFSHEVDQRVDNKTTHLWECLSKTFDGDGGHLYHFRAKDNHNFCGQPFNREISLKYGKVFDELFPALEYDFHIFFLMQDDFSERHWVNGVLLGFLENELIKPILANANNKEVWDYSKFEFLDRETQQQIRALDKDRDIFDLCKTIMNLCLSAFDDGKLTIDDVERSGGPIISYDDCSKFNKLFNALGYSCFISEKETIITLPNRRALLNRWKAYCTDHPEIELPEIDIHKQKGIASDMEFAFCFIEHDVLLSSDKEFVHDHLYHVIKLIMLVFDENKEGLSFADKYYQLRTQLRAVFVGIYDRLAYANLLCSSKNSGDANDKVLVLPFTNEEIQALEFALGVIIDSLSSFSKYDSFRPFNKMKIHQNLCGAAWNFDLNQKIWHKRWPDRLLPNPRRLGFVWECINALYQKRPDATPSDANESASIATI